MKTNLGIAALVTAMLSAAPVNAELPSNYKSWPIKQYEKGYTTYRESTKPDSAVVREFQSRVDAQGSMWLSIDFETIGYNSGSNLPPGQKPLEVYVLINPRYGLDKGLVERFRENMIRMCQQCHPVTNSGVRF